MWGQPMIVGNHPGAGSTAAPALVAHAPPDGYTLLINTSAQAYSAARAGELPYDPLRDFVPVAALTSQPYVLAAGRDFGQDSIRPGRLLPMAAPTLTVGQVVRAVVTRPRRGAALCPPGSLLIARPDRRR